MLKGADLSRAITDQVVIPTEPARRLNYLHASDAPAPPRSLNTAQALWLYEHETKRRWHAK